MQPLFNDLALYSNLPIWLIAIVLTWSLIWKGLALWKSARRNSSIWFIALLIINTMGVLEILYIFLFSEMKINNPNMKESKMKSMAKNSKRKVSKRSTRKRR